MIEPHELHNTTFRCSIPVRNYLDIYFILGSSINDLIMKRQTMAIWSLFTKQSKKAVLTNFLHQYGKSSKHMKKLVFLFPTEAPYILFLVAVLLQHVYVCVNIW